MRFSKSRWYREVYLRSLQWKRTRISYLQRVGWWCEECYYRPARVVHHLSYDRLYHEQPEDLMALCVECHDLIHKLPKPANDNEPQLPLAFPGSPR